MSTEIVFTITVNGKYKQKSENIYALLMNEYTNINFLITFNIIKVTLKDGLKFYNVVCYLQNNFYKCGNYKTLQHATNALRYYMKLGMRNKLLYRKCNYCNKRLSYPNNCNDCFFIDCSEWKVIQN